MHCLKYAQRCQAWLNLGEHQSSAHWQPVQAKAASSSATATSKQRIQASAFKSTFSAPDQPAMIAQLHELSLWCPHSMCKLRHETAMMHACTLHALTLACHAAWTRFRGPALVAVNDSSCRKTTCRAGTCCKSRQLHAQHAPPPASSAALETFAQGHSTISTIHCATPQAALAQASHRSSAGSNRAQD